MLPQVNNASNESRNIMQHTYNCKRCLIHKSQTTQRSKTTHTEHRHLQCNMVYITMKLTIIVEVNPIVVNS